MHLSLKRRRLIFVKGEAWRDKSNVGFEPQKEKKTSALTALFFWNAVLIKPYWMMTSIWRVSPAVTEKCSVYFLAPRSARTV